ncbi:TPA: regulator [Salmonella enterica subsp. enterica serovar Napoli]|nr:regulator [Salmonella enterica subsp. enterica serovar Napoli]
MKEIIFTETASAAIGSYSQGNAMGNLIFTSGQLPINADSGKIETDDIQEQTRQSLLNLLAVVKMAGGDTDTVLKTTCFLSDMADFAAFNDVYASFFKINPPARSCFAVKTLPMGARVEIEAVAFRQ